MQQTPPDLTIIIVNWNTRQLLLDCLAALPAATGDISTESWVVDNGSSDGSVEAVQAQFPATRVIANRGNRGFAAANNQAIRASRSRHVLLLNSDTVPRAGSLKALVDSLDAHPEVGIAGPRLLNADGSVQLSYAAFPNLRSELLGRNVRARRHYGPPQDGAYAVDWVGGACFLIRREAITVAGLLDEDYFMYTEEADWCFRVRAAGWEVCYYPAAEVVHLGGQSSRMASTHMKAELYKSKLRFFRKHYGWPRTLALWLGLQTIFLAKTVGGALLAVTPERGAAGKAIARDSGHILSALSRQLRHPPA